MKVEAYGFVAVDETFEGRNGEGRYIKLPIHTKLKDGGFSEEAEQWLTIFLTDKAPEGVDLSVEKGDRIRVAGYFTPDAENPQGGVVRAMELEILEKGNGGSNARSGGRSSGSNARSGSRSNGSGSSARSGGRSSGSSARAGGRSNGSSSSAGSRRSSGRF